jgi:hypothetical protein
VIGIWGSILHRLFDMCLTFGFTCRTLLKFFVAGLKFVALDLALFCLLFFGVPHLIGDEFFVFLLPEFRLPFFFIPLPEFVELPLPILGIF